MSATFCVAMMLKTANFLNIREETADDRDAVYEINRAAFGGNAEAALVERLHADGDVLLSLVAEEKGQVVGHVLFSRLPIETAQGVIQAAALAPLAVLPEQQGRGIGTALVEHGLTICRERGIPAVVVLGKPAYYGRFGFTADAARALQTPWSGPHLMAIELTAGSLTACPGIAQYPTAFNARLAD